MIRSCIFLIAFAFCRFFGIATLVFSILADKAEQWEEWARSNKNPRHELTGPLRDTGRVSSLPVGLPPGCTVGPVFKMRPGTFSTCEIGAVAKTLERRTCAVYHYRKEWARPKYYRLWQDLLHLVEGDDWFVCVYESGRAEDSYSQSCKSL